MQPPTFSLDEMLTAIERRLPGGRFTANIVFALLIIWLVFTAVGGIVDWLLPILEFFRSRQPPSWPALLDPDNLPSLASVMALVLFALSASAALSFFRTRTSGLEKRIQKLYAISALLELGERGTHKLLNAHVTPDGFTEWQRKVGEWEAAVTTALGKAKATDSQMRAFQTLVTFAPVGPAINDEHARAKGILAARLHRLRHLIEVLEQEVVT